MITGYLMGRFVGLRIPILRCLYWAAIYLLWNDPGALSSPAFQFSFIAVFSLIQFAGGGSGPVSWLRVAFVAAVCRAPIQVWHFGTFAPTGLVANVILTPFTALVVVPLGLFGVICAPVSQLPLECAAISAQGMVCVAESLVEVFGGSLILGRWMTPIATALALSLFLASRPKQLLLSWFFLVLLAGSMKPPEEYVDFIAVGQGDAILVVSRQTAAMVDVGPDRQQTESISPSESRHKTTRMGAHHSSTP